MKYLTDYLEEKQSALFKNYGAFWAFNTSQFEEGIQPGKKYVNLGRGLFAPKENYKEFISALEKVIEDARKEDVAENGKQGIIERELINLEVFYTGNLEEVYDRLKPYGIELEQIRETYFKMLPEMDNW